MSYSVNDSVYYAYTFEGEGYWSAATITALGASTPAQHADLHVTPLSAPAFDVTGKMHKTILIVNRWCTPAELENNEPASCGGGLR